MSCQDDSAVIKRSYPSETTPQRKTGLLKWTLINEARKRSKLIDRQPPKIKKDGTAKLTAHHKAYCRMWCVNYVIERHYEHHMKTDVLHLCISIMDRMLADDVAAVVMPRDYMLLAEAALFIALRSTPNEKKFWSFIPGNYYCPSKEVCIMESLTLEHLHHDVEPPTRLPIHYYKQLAKILSLDRLALNMGLFFMELVFCERRLSDYSSLVYAAGVLYIALRVTTESFSWGPFMVKVTGFDDEELCPVVHEMACTISKARRLKHFAVPIKTKYSESRFMSVSKLRIFKESVLLPKLAKST